MQGKRDQKASRAVSRVQRQVEPWQGSTPALTKLPTRDPSILHAACEDKFRRGTTPAMEGKMRSKHHTQNTTIFDQNHQQPHGRSAFRKKTRTRVGTRGSTATGAGLQTGTSTAISTSISMDTKQSTKVQEERKQTVDAQKHVKAQAPCNRATMHTAE